MKVAMITRFVFRLLTVLVAAMLLLPITLMAADAPTKPAPGSSPGSSSEVTVVTHPISKASVYNGSAGSLGVFAVGIGRNHPVPDANLFYGGGYESPGTSYLSVYDYTGDVVYTSASGFSSEGPSGGYAIAYLGGCGVTFSSTGTRSITRWSPCGDLNVEQVVEVLGSTLSDSAVRVATKVTNTSGGRERWASAIYGT